MYCIIAYPTVNRFYSIVHGEDYPSFTSGAVHLTGIIPALAFGV